jgi:deferrochelatase/peroxidase EfeB
MGSRVRHPNTFQALDQLPSGDVGLLFMCFQASIRHQFAFMQRAWCNAANFVRNGTGLDPVIGQPPAPPAMEQSWPKDYGNPGSVKFRFEHFVRVRGGEYFFAPSLPFLNSLCDA